MIQVETLQGSAKTDIRLDVSCSGMTIRVGPGSFRVAGVDYEFSEEQTATLDASPGQLSVMGYIVCDPGSTDAYLFVDDVPEVNGGYDHYDWVEGGPKPIHVLFIANVPQGTTDMSDVDVRVFLRKPPAVEEAKNG
jgi:hypothetical protein